MPSPHIFQNNPTGVPLDADEPAVAHQQKPPDDIGPEVRLPVVGPGAGMGSAENGVVVALSTLLPLVIIFPGDRKKSEEV